MPRDMLTIAVQGVAAAVELGEVRYLGCGDAVVEYWQHSDSPPYVHCDLTIGMGCNLA